MRPLLPPTLLAAAVVLAACQPQRPQEQAAPPADAPAAPPATAQAPTATDFSRDMVALGTEPFWSVTMRGTEFEFLRPGQETVKLTAPGAEIRPGEGVWRATAEGGQPMTITLRTGQCSDGMSDRTYPMSAEVEFEGQTLHGCAASAEAIRNAAEDAVLH